MYEPQRGTVQEAADPQDDYRGDILHVPNQFCLLILFFASTGTSSMSILVFSWLEVLN